MLHKCDSLEMNENNHYIPLFFTYNLMIMETFFLFLMVSNHFVTMISRKKKICFHKIQATIQEQMRGAIVVFS